MKPDREFIEDALSGAILDPRTRALYELCFMQRHHDREETVADKLRMMVKVCQGQGLKVNAFSPELFAHRLALSGLDTWFAGLATAEQLEPAQAFEVQKRLTDMFDDLPLGQARALASRYLHYHFPELFYIYDPGLERAAYALGEGACGYLARNEHDPVYSGFFACCNKLAARFAPLAGHRLSPRELDRLLRAWRDQLAVSAPTSSGRAAFAGLAA